MQRDHFGLEPHPLRTTLSNEMHVRKLPPLAAPTRLMQVVLISDDEGVPRERQRLAQLCGLPFQDIAQARFVDGEFDGMRVIWERHSEFSSYLIIKPGEFEDPFAPTAFEALPRDWFAGLGRVIRATQIALAKAAEPPPVAGLFLEQDLVVCDVADGAAQVWSDFRLHNDGFGRLLLLDKGLSGQEAAMVVQRLQELGNYRNMTLLGLPVAQVFTPTLSRYEVELASLSSAIAGGATEDRVLLERLSKLSAALANLVAETRYRMSASQAYAAITQERLQSLRVHRVQGYQTLGDFTDRRLLPAVRTCVSFSVRLEDLSQRLAWTSSLLRTRVDTAVSQQNRDLLASMDRRTDLQLRLQQTVEGLSVVAISYYMVGLISHVTSLLGLLGLHIDHGMFTAAAVPLVVGGAWLAKGRLRRKLRQ